MLENDRVILEATPSFGGRLLSFSRKGQKNLLKLGEPVITRPEPEVTAMADHIDYLGHSVWVGPQNEWWEHQSLNPTRKASGSSWPPDPFLVFGKNTLIESTDSTLVLEGMPSPVSGVQLRKTFRLLDADENGHDVELEVAATNIRDRDLAWDIWFNTRLHPSARVYVPVASPDDFWLNQLDNNNTGPLLHSLAEGVFSLDLKAPSQGKTGRKGKAFIQPSQGWMAAFTQGQVFIISFPLQPRSAIHPQQGQVELFLDYRPDTPAEGLLEMELHAPYRRLAPGETMQAKEYWRVLRYSGPDQRAAHVKFLRDNAVLVPEDAPAPQ